MQEDKQQQSAIRKVVASALIGATIEWYDFFLYGVVAGLVFNKLYFPGSDPVVSTMLAYATFAVGFMTRPLGGVIFGHFGDKLGRKSMLILTLMIMGVATFLIGLVPTYDQIGVWAPVALLLLRIAQGIGLGGEWGGAVLMAYEYAPKEKRGFYASLPQIGLAIGLCLASGVVALLSSLLTDEQFLAWGWRIAFLLSGAMVFVGMYIRMAVKETPEFAAIKERNEATQIPFVDMIKRYPGNILKGMGARYIDGVFFNVFGVFSISYLTSTLKISRTEALIGVMAAAVTMIFTIPFFGHLSDKVGRARVYFWGSLITAFSAFPAFWLMTHSGGNMFIIWLSIIIPFGI
ncbi:MAG: MFS transporter, partial [Burkholderiaceae bacterium]